ncbi:FAD-dependent monooxygenase [Streptomyces sp. NPDC126514]|uniref:FAD-dependent monooxygenase n=1 Tax=Streptomyces sp. NPDC126514 TaxID=3155210 RepID=UPI00331B2782
MGGSIAGCAAALATWRAGAAEVTVFERTAGRLQDRGAGLVLHNDRYTELKTAGYLDDAVPWIQLARRPWVVRDGGEHAGRTIGTLAFPFRSYNWGSLWNALRRRLPDAVGYRTGAAIAGVTSGPDEAVLRLADGTQERFDLVVGADGYRSALRPAVQPDARARYTGYLAWRGTLPASLLPEPPGAFPDEDAPTVVFPGGHMIIYRIPAGQVPLVNWVFYATPPPGRSAAVTNPAATPSRTATKALLKHQELLMEHHFPPYWREVVRRTPPEALFVQPIYDLDASRFARGRLLLLGDAASIARPHTGSGALKALQDAAVLESTLRSARDLGEALRAYDAARVPAGQAMQALGRSLGRDMVEETPSWATMDQRATEDWWQRAAGTGTAGIGGPGLTR